jgi:signal transduction histidine kinase
MKPTSLRQIRRAFPLGIALVALLILNGTSWWAYRASTQEVGQNFQRHLRDTADLLAGRILDAYWEELEKRPLSLDSISMEGTEDLPFETLVVPFEEWLAKQGTEALRRFPGEGTPPFQDLYLLGPEGSLLGSLTGDLIPNDRPSIHPFLAADDAPTIQAVKESGIPQVTPEFLQEGLYYLTAYAPVRMGGSFEGLVGVRANILFGDRLIEIRNRILLADALGSILVALLAWMFHRLAVGLERTEDSLRHRERLAQLGEMVSVVAHEIRNPLGIIEQTAEVLRRRYAKDRKDELLDYISEEVDRLNRIVTRFLDFSRPVHPEETIEKSCDLAAEIHSVAESYRAAAEEKGAGILEDLADTRLTVRGLGSDEVRQILINLVLNSLEAVGEGGQVILRGAHRGGRVLLEVRDNGPGMSLEQLEKARSPFFTTKEKGSGLGLALVGKLVEQGQAQWEIRSDPGQGCSVSISFNS